jgi:hypothetical protein
MSPTITAYVTDVNERIKVSSPFFSFYLYSFCIQNLVKEHPDVFKVPAAVFQDPGLNSQLTGLLKELLTDCRGGMKQKVSPRLQPKLSHSLPYQLVASLGPTKGRSRPQNVVELARAMAPRGMDINNGHYARVAFMVRLQPPDKLTPC